LGQPKNGLYIVLIILGVIILVAARYVLDSKIAPRPVPAPSPAQLAPAISPQPSSGYSAEIVKTRIAPFDTGDGVRQQMILVDWKNTGTLPIGTVNATMTFFDKHGREIEEVKDYTIFLTESQDKTIKPGETYVEADGDGFVIIALPPLYRKAARADMVLTKVGGVPPPI